MEVVARAESERGEVVVRRRDTENGDSGDSGILELRVNGVFVMDTTQTTTERLLARATLDRVAHPRRVLVGGLGLGYTVRELLADERVEHVTVAEIEPAVVAWMHDGVLPGEDVLADPRVDVAVTDVRRAVAEAAPRSFDVVLLDVDNGPDFLVYDDNAAVYDAAFLAACRRLLTDDGAVAVWSSTYSPALACAGRDVFGGFDAVPVAVDLQGRDERYWLFASKMVP